MRNQLFELPEKERKVFGFNDEQLMISSKRHKSFESLLESSVKSGLLETMHIIPISSIKHLEFNEREDGFTIGYENKKGKLKEAYVKPNNSLRDPILSELASMINLNKSVNDESTKKTLGMNGLGLVAIGIATWIFRGIAVDAQHGGHYEATGRKRGITQFVVDIIEKVDPIWITLIGALTFIYFAFKAYKRFKNPASVIRFE